MLELTTETFADKIKSSQPVVVDFWAEWCMPCKIFAPVLEELSDELDGKAEFCKVNVDDFSDLAAQYGIASIPTLIVFKNSEAVERSSGVIPKDDVAAMVGKHL